MRNFALTLAAAIVVFAVFFGIGSFISFARSKATATTAPPTPTTYAWKVLVIEGKWDAMKKEGKITRVAVETPNPLATIVYGIIRALAISQYGGAYLHVEIFSPYGTVVKQLTRPVPSTTFREEIGITDLYLRYEKIVVKAKLCYQRMGKYGIPEEVKVVDEVEMELSLR